MIQFCENAVKLLKLKPNESVKIMIFHTEQVIIVPISRLESDWTEAQGGPNLEISIAINDLNQEEWEYKQWKKANG